MNGQALGNVTQDTAKVSYSDNIYDHRRSITVAIFRFKSVQVCFESKNMAMHPTDSEDQQRLITLSLRSSFPIQVASTFTMQSAHKRLKPWSYRTRCVTPGTYLSFLINTKAPSPFSPLPSKSLHSSIIITTFSLTILGSLAIPFNHFNSHHLSYLYDPTTS